MSKSEWTPLRDHPVRWKHVYIAYWHVDEENPEWSEWRVASTPFCHNGAAWHCLNEERNEWEWRGDMIDKCIGEHSKWMYMPTEPEPPSARPSKM